MVCYKSLLYMVGFLRPPATTSGWTTFSIGYCNSEIQDGVQDGRHILKSTYYPQLLLYLQMQYIVSMVFEVRESMMMVSEWFDVIYVITREKGVTLSVPTSGSQQRPCVMSQPQNFLCVTYLPRTNRSPGPPVASKMLRSWRLYLTTLPKWCYKCGD